MQQRVIEPLYQTPRQALGSKITSRGTPSQGAESSQWQLCTHNPPGEQADRENTSGRGRRGGVGTDHPRAPTWTPWGGRGAANTAGGEGGEGASSEIRSPGQAGCRGPAGREGSILSKPMG